MDMDIIHQAPWDTINMDIAAPSIAPADLDIPILLPHITTTKPSLKKIHKAQTTSILYQGYHYNLLQSVPQSNLSSALTLASSSTSHSIKGTFIWIFIYSSQNPFCQAHYRFWTKKPMKRLQNILGGNQYGIRNSCLASQQHLGIG